MEKFKGYIEALKCAGVPSFTRELAFTLNLQLDINVEKGIIREVTFFEVSGDKYNINMFKKMLKKSIDEYQNR